MRFHAAAAIAAVLSILGGALPAGAVDQIVMSELREEGVQYGKYAGRLETCKITPPHPVKTAWLKHARERGALPTQIEILSRVFDDGQARVRGLTVGFSEEECAEKIKTKQGRELFEQIEEWYALD